MFKIVKNAFIVQVYLRNCPWARICQRAPPLLSISGTVLFPAIFQNVRHKNLIWIIYPVLFDVES